MKNAYAKKALANRAGRDAEMYKKGYNDGIDLTLNIVAIALNDEFQFGAERMTRLETRVQKLFDEVIETGDREVNQSHIRQRVQQIRGAGYEVFKEG